MFNQGLQQCMTLKIHVNKLWNYYTWATSYIGDSDINAIKKKIAQKNKICEIWDSYSGAVENSSLLGCNTMLLGG
jgi:hypothetical protein